MNQQILWSAVVSSILTIVVAIDVSWAQDKKKPTPADPMILVGSWSLDYGATVAAPENKGSEEMIAKLYKKVTVLESYDADGSWKQRSTVEGRNHEWTGTWKWLEAKRDSARLEVDVKREGKDRITDGQTNTRVKFVSRNRIETRQPGSPITVFIFNRHKEMD